MNTKLKRQCVRDKSKQFL